MNTTLLNQTSSDNSAEITLKADNVFKNKINNLAKGEILIPLKDNSNNVLYAAKTGWKVTAIDLTEIDYKIIKQEAIENGIGIDYSISNYTDSIIEGKKYDCIVISRENRSSQEVINMMRKMINHLKPNGQFIIDEEIANHKTTTTTIEKSRKNYSLCDIPKKRVNKSLKNNFGDKKGRIINFR